MGIDRANRVPPLAEQVAASGDQAVAILGIVIDEAGFLCEAAP
jgi:hypothetical protein